MSVRLLSGDCRRAMRLMAHLGVRVDSIVTDPPYHLTSIVKRFGANGAAPAKDRDGLYQRASAGFMGQKWDGGDVAFDLETWALALAVLKPGGHLLAFGGTRGWHRLACAIEDAGFEIRDTVAWIYGAGFPKGHNVALAYEKRLCTQDDKGDWFYVDGQPMRKEAPFRDADANQWAGFNVALKPAFEPIILARRSLSEKSVAANVLRHGTGAVNVDGCRVYAGGEGPAARESEESQDRRYDDKGSTNIAAKPGKRYKVKRLKPGATLNKTGGNWRPEDGPDYHGELKEGRWPANVCHDGSEEVEAAFAAFGERPTCDKSQIGLGRDGNHTKGIYGAKASKITTAYGDIGTASRFFYCAKAGPDDRFGSKHPTVKPVALMRWLVRLVTPPGGLVLDPFAGSGTTGQAAIAEGMRAVLIEAEPEYQADIRARLAHCQGEGGHSAAVKQRHRDPPQTHGPLFGEAAE